MYHGLEYEVGRLIKEERRRRGWTQGQLSYKAKIGGSGTLCNIERGKSKVSAEMLFRICDAFKMSVDDLLGVSSSLNARKKVAQREGRLGRCPVCSKSVKQGDNARTTDNYCPRCGQALKW